MSCGGLRARGHHQRCADPHRPRCLARGRLRRGPLHDPLAAPAAGHGDQRRPGPSARAGQAAVRVGPAGRRHLRRVRRCALPGRDRPGGRGLRRRAPRGRPPRRRAGPLRGNVNAMFTNLSRRSQGLIQRQLSLISELESREADPDQLSSLFKLDHLATRMRRNGENLLVLAGEEPGRRWTRPVPLVDVLRAAASEVEQYERIELASVPGTEVAGRVVNDLVHLLAELLENATSFSSPQTKVRSPVTRCPTAVCWSRSTTPASASPPRTSPRSTSGSRRRPPWTSRSRAAWVCSWSAGCPCDTASASSCAPPTPVVRPRWSCSPSMSPTAARSLRPGSPVRAARAPFPRRRAVRRASARRPRRYGRRPSRALGGPGAGPAGGGSVPVRRAARSVRARVRAPRCRPVTVVRARASSPPRASGPRLAGASAPVRGAGAERPGPQRAADTASRRVRRARATAAGSCRRRRSARRTARQPPPRGAAAPSAPAGHQLGQRAAGRPAAPCRGLAARARGRRPGRGQGRDVRVRAAGLQRGPAAAAVPVPPGSSYGPTCSALRTPSTGQYARPDVNSSGAGSQDPASTAQFARPDFNAPPAPAAGVRVRAVARTAAGPRAAANALPPQPQPGGAAAGRSRRRPYSAVRHAGDELVPRSGRAVSPRSSSRRPRRCPAAAGGASRLRRCRSAPPRASPATPGNAPNASGAAWRTSPNDELVRQAERVRKPAAGGVTTSGLPRRVPRANLVPGTAQQQTPPVRTAGFACAR